MSDVTGTKVWQCRLCNFEHINKKGAVQHFMLRHTPNNQIPYLCNICNFKALTEDYDEEITSSEEEVAIVEVEINVHVDERDEQIEELKNKIKEMEEEYRKETDKKEIHELEKRHKYECLRFGNFIEKLKREKKELKKELKSAEKKLENENICTKKIKSVVTLPTKRKLYY
ncbi:Hypothetical predicted protein [Mytilus galloprovincialis]|uniref:C2H2-type domain-containing protein n=1 Tax=Mytilus galloprovincialis TaxID=29158 RepID=A0A8B6DWB0_MYTGA|nr:Hypothetical predicted protein [Mytilus galloprovincialis]